jgi:hypothetical protein
MASRGYGDDTRVDEDPRGAGSSDMAGLADLRTRISQKRNSTIWAKVGFWLVVCSAALINLLIVLTADYTNLKSFTLWILKFITSI